MSTTNGKKVGRKPKYDFRNEELLRSIEALAKKGATDKEIAVSLGMSPTTFCEKKVEFEELREVLSRAREALNSLVRATYLQTALGKSKAKNVVTQYSKSRCQCEGTDQTCPFCGGTGFIVSENRAVITETESDIPPSLQALSTWLYHHDKEWRAVVDKKNEDGETLAAPRTLTKEEAREMWNTLDDEY